MHEGMRGFGERMGHEGAHHIPTNQEVVGCHGAAGCQNQFLGGSSMVVTQSRFLVPADISHYFA